MPNTPQSKTPALKGIPVAWAELPKRKCMYCGNRFQPVRPEQRFCPPAPGTKDSGCRRAFHQNGGGWPKVMGSVQSAVRKEIQTTIQKIREENEVLRFKVEQLESAVAKLKRRR